ncbi:hypothetical protein AWB66_02819 [Caballeronia telluris]|uniref:Uncharacterized protein n=1 Tax=Caballeronia telluris TaxID=326475 RepID=A0A158HZR7_9BURK|nr:hypothetical protein AWB66_02819 [Caballeronia telluris]
MHPVMPRSCGVKRGGAAGRRDGAAPVDSGAMLSVALTGWLALIV